MTITAEQARANSSNSKHGTQEVLKSVYSSIEASSKTGSKSISQILSKEAVSEVEIEAALTDIKSKGYNVEVENHSSNHYHLKLTW